jgi:uncharacterized protein YdaU (DUF1376 family)
MPLFWGDFLANTMHLSAQEAGAYLFLIAHAWEHDGTIPAERTRLACIAHVRESHWTRIWKALEPFFEPLHCSLGVVITGYSHKRVRDELLRLGKISNKRKAAAEQMHSKSNSFASTSTSTSNKESFLGKQEEVSPVQMHGPSSLELQLAQKRHLGISPDKGMNYRAPPAKKSDNVLTPIPDLSLQARKKAGE